MYMLHRYKGECKVLDLPDDEYLSPDTEEAIAASALAGGDTKREEEPLQPDDVLALEDQVFATEFAGQGPGVDVPSTLAANTGRRTNCTPATSDHPAKRTRERTQQSPWHPAQPSSVFPLDRAQVMAERTAGMLNPMPAPVSTHTRTADTHILGSNSSNGPSLTPTGVQQSTSFMLSHEQLLAIISAAQAGTLANLAHAPVNAITAALGTFTVSLSHHELTQILGVAAPSQTPHHEHHNQQAQASLPPSPPQTSLDTHGNRSYIPSNAPPCRAYLGMHAPEPFQQPSLPFLSIPNPNLGTPFPADPADARPHLGPLAQASGFTPLKILRSGFQEHIPLHHISNKLMEEATFQSPSSSGRIQISGQTIRLESVRLEMAGERKLTPETWIECSMNLIHAIAEHLLAGNDGRCGGPTARVIAARFEQHFTNLRSKADFISHFRIYLEYDIHMRSRWVTLSHNMDIAVWQPHIMEGLVLADIHCTSDAMISALSNFQNSAGSSQSGSSSSRGRSTQQTSFRDSNRDRSATASASNKNTSAASKTAAVIFCMLCRAA
ncbi:hypothetical protein H0H92_009158 [Tricholoma furcatifolium]|nr:hypothetical protein H0H92_009158 [Tricholoma furcatifolium]